MGSVQALSTLISWSNDPSASWSCLDEVMEALMLCGPWAGDRVNMTQVCSRRAQEYESRNDITARIADVVNTFAQAKGLDQFNDDGNEDKYNEQCSMHVSSSVLLSWALVIHCTISQISYKSTE